MDNIEIIKLFSKLTTVQKFAAEVGYESFKDITEKFNEVLDELKEEKSKEEKKLAEYKQTVEKLLENVPEHLREEFRLKLTATPAVETKEKKERKERKQRAPSEVITVKVKDQVFDVKMAGKVNDDLKVIMEEAGFTTKERKEFVEKFRVQPKPVEETEEVE
ncbi:MAG: hypothetical protein WC013_00980 [Aeromonas bestiarum]